jgi:hypothetical protein
MSSSAAWMRGLSEVLHLSASAAAEPSILCSEAVQSENLLQIPLGVGRDFALRQIIAERGERRDDHHHCGE